MYLAAVAPPAPPPITTTLGKAPNEIDGIESVATEAVARPVKVRLEIFDIMSSPNKLTVKMLSAFTLK